MNSNLKNYFPKFGVEIHAELMTRTKAFSSAKVSKNERPNLNVNQIDLGYPGAKPSVNKKMVELAYRACKAFDMEIDHLLRFDRKNYYYPDLPKGFQITQFNFPIGKNGKIKIIKENGIFKDIYIRQLHMEEDTAKQIKKDNFTYFDFNRTGIPLIEIVSGHEDFENIDEVILYVKQLREQLMFLEINDGKLFEGSFRVDINVSVSNDKDKLGERVEIKNLNSYNNIKEALNYEINEQINLLKNNKKIEKVTKKFDENKKETIKIRNKDSNIDYNFIPEGNITPIKLSKKNISDFDSYKIIKTSDLRKKLFEKEISEDQISILLQYRWFYDLAMSFEKNYDLKKVINFLTTTFYSILLSKKYDLFKFSVPNNFIKRIIDLLFKNKITNSDAKDIIYQLINKTNDFSKISKYEIHNLADKDFYNVDIDSILSSYEKRELTSNNDLINIINKLIEKNIDMIEKDYKNRSERIFKFMMGQVMKETKGKVNAKEASDKIKELLKKYE